MKTELEELAEAVLEVLDGQRAYFQHKGAYEEKQILLTASKTREGRLRARCQAILNPPPADLFTPGDPT